MSGPFVGEIRMFAGNFAPVGWAFCAGQLQPISENETLFQLIGTTYGGDGQSTFALPDLRGRLAMHQGTGLGLPSVIIGETGGTESITLTTQQIAAHPHSLLGDAGGTTKSPANAIPAVAGGGPGGLTTYQPTGGAITQLSPKMISNTGQNLPHENRQPFLCISFIISLFGIFPSPT
jgi:microcystin-dependent protein